MNWRPSRALTASRQRNGQGSSFPPWISACRSFRVSAESGSVAETPGPWSSRLVGRAVERARSGSLSHGPDREAEDPGRSSGKPGERALPLLD